MPTRRKSIVPANPGQWSEKSQRSVSFLFTSKYEDREYKCWSCGKTAVFTAEDQKYTYEVRKASIDQQRVLCAECRKVSLQISKDLESCESRWVIEKSMLEADRAFLSHWLDLLEKREHYVRYRPDKAKKNMLRKLLLKD
jgi:hypothetical protein